MRDISGSANPNFKNAGQRVCEKCKSDFKSYDTKRKYCSFLCYNTTRPLRLKPKKSRRHMLSGPPEACRTCGKPCKAVGKKYCSMTCVGMSRSHGLSRTCDHCQSVFKYSPSNVRKFCSYPCFVANGGPVRAGLKSAETIMKKYGAKKDANHSELMTVITQFCAVHDLSHAGYGVPDGLAYVKGEWRLFDIKNPKTSYGRRGLNPRQKKWVQDWRGGPVYLLHDVDEAQAFAKGSFDGLQVHMAGSAHLTMHPIDQTAQISVEGVA